MGNDRIIMRCTIRDNKGVERVKAGEVFTEENVRSIRPGHGMHPRHLKEVLGRRAARDIKRGTPLSRELIAGD